MFEIRLGIPEVYNFWAELRQKIDNNTANKDDVIRYKKIGKTLKHISIDPKYPGLCSHEIKVLSTKYNIRIFESYIENNKPSAGRIFWIYGPNSNEITIVGIESHPNNKQNSYERIKLSIIKQ